MKLTLQAVQRAIGGRLHLGSEGDHPDERMVTPFSTVCTDTRKLEPGALFVALRGETFDGHHFVGQALTQGVLAAVVDEAGHKALPRHCPQWVVPDTLWALGALAQLWRATLAKPVVAITGSNGKTTTKELLAQALSLKGDVHKTPGNLNNLVGLPLTVFAWPKQAWAAVLEMGMNAPGEIARLTDIGQPDAGLITCVAAAHLQGLGTLERVAQAKVELLQRLPKGKVAIINGDDAILCAAAKPHLADRPSLLFGRGGNAQVRLVSAEHRAMGSSFGLHVQLSVHGQNLSATLPLVGPHNGMNAAAAVAAAMAMDVAPDAALQAMAQVQVPGSRGRVVRNARAHLAIIDDCYNANPQSMAAALTTLIDLAGHSPKVAVLGDMLELGPTAEQHHRALGAQARKLGIEHLFAFGAHSQDVIDGAGGHGHAFAADDLEALTQGVCAAASGGSWCLVKGSRGMRMERIVESLMAYGPSTPHRPGRHGGPQRKSC